MWPDHQVSSEPFSGDARSSRQARESGRSRFDSLGDLGARDVVDPQIGTMRANPIPQGKLVCPLKSSDRYGPEADEGERRVSGVQNGLRASTASALSPG